MTSPKFGTIFDPLCHTLVPYAFCPGVKKSLTALPLLSGHLWMFLKVEQAIGTMVESPGEKILVKKRSNISVISLSCILYCRISELAF